MVQLLLNHVIFMGDEGNVIITLADSVPVRFISRAVAWIVVRVTFDPAKVKLASRLAEPYVALGVRKTLVPSHAKLIVSFGRSVIEEPPPPELTVMVYVPIVQVLFTVQRPPTPVGICRVTLADRVPASDQFEGTYDAVLAGYAPAYTLPFTAIVPEAAVSVNDCVPPKAKSMPLRFVLSVVDHPLSL